MSVRIGVVGSGFLARHFVLAAARHRGYSVTKVLTRRPVARCSDFPLQSELTNSVGALIDSSDVVLECSGDPIHAADVIAAALDAGLPVVTMNTEFHVTVGSYFAGRGVLTEAEGDQPGCQAALKEEAEELGFRPLVYGNMKGFQNLAPTRKEMRYWGEKQGISLPMVTSFTDGTKLQFEQALVANGLGADIAQSGLIGPEEDDLRTAAGMLAQRAEEIGFPISDYVLSPKLPHGVFVVGTHDSCQQLALQYFKLGEGPYYVLQKTNIFVHLEIMKTIRQVVETGRVLLNNSARPKVSVAAVAKKRLQIGTKVAVGIGSFEVRGVAVRMREHRGHLPIGLMQDAVLRRRVEPGDVLSLDDVDLQDSLALRAWLDTEGRVVVPGSAQTLGAPNETAAQL